MSYFRPHIIWQSPDGTWSLGIFRITTDYEGAPYDDSKFEYAFTGGADVDAVVDACRRQFGNFGSLDYDTRQDSLARQYDQMVEELGRSCPRDVEQVRS